MTRAKRDTNQIAVGLGYDETNTTTKPLLMDSVTDRLLLLGVASSSGGTVSTKGIAERDSNGVTTILAWKDDNSGLAPISMDSDGNILIDLIVE
jgi:hypothetical protein